MKPIDPRALKLLLSTRWSVNGWHDEIQLTSSERAMLSDAGLYHEPIECGHDQLVRDCIAMRDHISLVDVATGFMASLSTRRLDIRSALGSWMAARHLPLHSMETSPNELWQTGNRCCLICGGIDWAKKSPVDLNILNVERHKWGGVRHECDLAYTWFDLREFSKLGSITATGADRDILRNILSVADNMPADARPSDLEKALSKVLKSNAYERRVLITIMALGGVLKPIAQPEMRLSFVPISQRTLPVMGKVDWQWPAVWWRGKDGVNHAAVNEIFAGLL